MEYTLQYSHYPRSIGPNYRREDPPSPEKQKFKPGGEHTQEKEKKPLSAEPEAHHVEHTTLPGGRIRLSWTHPVDDNARPL